MSEAEKKRRFDYKQNRSKWIKIISAIVVIVSLITILFSVTYYKMNKNYYIGYTENGAVDYRVYLKENDFFEEEYLGKDQVYIASLVERVMADFRYELKMEEQANFNYTYKVNAILEIADRSTGVSYYHPAYELVPEQSITLDGATDKIAISESVEIDYDTYNEMAKKFISTYQLKDTKSALVLEMQINIISSCENFEEDNNNSYTVSLHIPLTEQKVDVEISSSVPTEESKILACNKNTAKHFFLVLSIIMAVIDAIIILLLVAFIYITINSDITYESKVRKIVSNYKSYIQQINNPFDMEGYQLLYVNEFTEMLEIRDTIQSPILMNENADKTCTKFIIPTNTKLLYIFEIKVDDYDLLYNEQPEEEVVPTEEPEMEEETVILMEEVDEEELAEAIATPSFSLDKIDYDPDDDEEEEEGVEVIGVVWPERARHNKVYRYDPSGERVTNGDIVLVPTRDAAQNRNVIRKATVAHGNHKVDPEHLHHPLKKIIGIVRRKTEEVLAPRVNENADNK